MSQPSIKTVEADEAAKPAPPRDPDKLDAAMNAVKEMLAGLQVSR